MSPISEFCGLLTVSIIHGEKTRSDSIEGFLEFNLKDQSDFSFQIFIYISIELDKSVLTAGLKDSEWKFKNGLILYWVLEWIFHEFEQVWINEYFGMSSSKTHDEILQFLQWHQVRAFGIFSFLIYSFQNLRKMILIFCRPGSLKPWLNQTCSHPFEIQSGSRRTATRNLNIQDSEDVEVLRRPDFLHLQDYDS